MPKLQNPLPRLENKKGNEETRHQHKFGMECCSLTSNEKITYREMLFYNIYSGLNKRDI